MITSLVFAESKVSNYGSRIALPYFLTFTVYDLMKYFNTKLFLTRTFHANI